MDVGSAPEQKDQGDDPNNAPIDTGSAPVLKGRWADVDDAATDDAGIEDQRADLGADSQGTGSDPDDPDAPAPASGEADSESDDGSQAIYMATCSACGATHCLDFDVFELGMDFQCGHAGFECMASSSSTSASLGSLSQAVRQQPGSQPLSSEEQHELFQRFVLEKQGGKAENGVAQSSRQLMAKTEIQKVRYRDGQVVTHKGERFIKEDRNPMVASGCAIGGVLGARKAGRMGLGLKKRPKEEVDKICISNKNRAHTKKDSGHKDVYVFESKWGPHAPQ